ncbi:MAG TPA: Tol-Pal system beta propeller repeat protein TolB [Magnetospirillaceae bacterium]|jgi:TolB protein
MKRHSIILSFVAALVLLAPARYAAADLVLDINHPNVQPLPIAITDFAGNSDQEKQLGRNISSVVSHDLESSGLFKPIDPKAFIQTPDSLRTSVRFQDWKAVNAQALVQGTTELAADGHLRVEFRLWDVFAENQMTGLAFNAQSTGWRRVAHIVADAIYKRITGEDGYFDTQIVYVSEGGPATKRITRLALMDQDGENNRFLTDGSDLVLTPRFSPNQREITYMSFYRDTPRVYVLHLDNGRRELLGDFPGMTFAPRFSPDSNKVIMSLATNGTSSIYELDLRTRHSTRLTTSTAIDTSPCYSPDGTKVTFESDRSGTQQIYVMNADGSGQTRISFGDGRYATPVWSPRGDLLAFTKIKGGEFYIGVMRPDGSGERLLAKGFLVEGPTWAPNGRVIAYTRQDPNDPSSKYGTVKLYSIDLTGYNERRLVTPQDASAPAWSPLLP